MTLKNEEDHLAIDLVGIVMTTLDVGPHLMRKIGEGHMRWVVTPIHIADLRLMRSLGSVKIHE